MTAIFLFLFLFNTLNLPSLRERYALKAYHIAMLAVFLWALNPIQTQAVTYIVQRMASLAGMFYIMGMYFYLKTRTATSRGTKRTYILLCFVSFVLALGSKENAVMLPLSLLLYETLVIQEDPHQFFRNNVRIFLMVFCIFLSIFILYLVYKGESILSFMSGYGGRPFTMNQRLLTEPRILLFYISLLIYPVPSRFSIAHSIQISTSLFNPVWTFFSVFLIGVSIVYLTHRARKYPLISFCFLFFFLNHIVESTIIPLELIFEHRNYIPSMMFFVPIAIWVSFILERYALNKPMKFIISAFVIFFLIGIGNATFLRNFAWKDEKSLWTDAAEKASDQFRVHQHLGLYWQNHGHNAKAISEFEKALKSPSINRKDEVIIGHYHLGKLYADLEDYEKAESFYQKALTLDPKSYYALGNLAAIYGKTGKTDLADQYLMKAIKANPGDPFMNLNMGLYQLRKRRPEKAIHHFMVSLNEKKLEKRALLYLGIAYKQKGWLGRAATSFEKSLTMDENNISPHLHLLEIYSKKAHKAMTQQEAETIIDLMLRNQALFYHAISLILEDGHLGHVQLSSSLILPPLIEACHNNSETPKEWKDYMMERLDSKIRQKISHSRTTS